MKENIIVSETLSDYVTLLLNSKKIEDQYRLYFRGERKFYETRIPSFYNDDYLILEGGARYYKSLMGELGRDYSDKNASLVRIFSEMQHYGAKTSFLDITTNPLIAAFFAVEDGDDKDEGDGYVYVYGVEKYREKYDTDLEVVMKTAFNLMEAWEIYGYLSGCEIVINCAIGKVDKVSGHYKEKSGGFNPEEYNFLWNISVRDSCSFNSELIAYLKKLGVDDKEIGKVERCLPGVCSFMEKINIITGVNGGFFFPFKLYFYLTTSQLVIPSKCTDRIRQQQGAFIYPAVVNYYITKQKKCGNSENSLDNEENIKQEVRREVDESVRKYSTVLEHKENGEKYSAIRIPKKCKAKYRQDLSLLGITPAFVYPGVAKQSQTILEDY